MTKEELEKDYYADRPTEPYCDDDSPNDWVNIAHYAEENLEKAFKRIAELEEKISVLLSCKNCPENKGGLLCQKEYEDKCLAQKIQYIKELKEENAELKSDSVEWEKASDKWKSVYELTNNQLTKAKDILRMIVYWKSDKKELSNFINKTEQFLNCSEKPNN